MTLAVEKLRRRLQRQRHRTFGWLGRRAPEGVELRGLPRHAFEHGCKHPRGRRGSRSGCEKVSVGVRVVQNIFVPYHQLDVRHLERFAPTQAYQ